MRAALHSALALHSGNRCSTTSEPPPVVTNAFAPDATVHPLQSIEHESASPSNAGVRNHMEMSKLTPLLCASHHAVVARSKPIPKAKAPKKTEPTLYESESYQAECEKNEARAR